ncbi:MAG: hypothetical protein J0H50_13805 [Xanthomonadales bacterium]|nr:hypothetical protein [Xanthomonadales bacterium]
MKPLRPTRTIGLLAYNGMQALDLAGPFDVFGAANTLAGDPSPYALWVVGLGVEAVRAENGLAFVPSHTLEDTPPLEGSTPILRTLSLSPILGQRSVHVEAQALQP